MIVPGMITDKSYMCNVLYIPHVTLYRGRAIQISVRGRMKTQPPDVQYMQKQAVGSAAEQTRAGKRRGKATC